MDVDDLVECNTVITIEWLSQDGCHFCLHVQMYMEYTNWKSKCKLKFILKSLTGWNFKNYLVLSATLKIDVHVIMYTKMLLEVS